MRRHLQLLMIVTSASMMASAGEIPSPNPVVIRETGSLAIAPESKQAAHLTFYKGAYPARTVTDSLKKSLSRAGYKWVDDESKAALVMTLSGYVRIFNDLNDARLMNGSTAKVDMGELLESGIKVSEQAATSIKHDLLYFDTGVALQSARLASMYGANYPLATGIGGAIAIDWLADYSGLRDALNGAFNKLVFGNNFPNKPLFCGEECQDKYRRVHHQVELNVRVWRGLDGTDFTIIADRVDEKIGDPMPVVEKVLAVMVERLAEAGQ